MSYISNYDPNEELPSPSIDAVNQIFNFQSMFDFNKVPTPAGMIPSNHSSLSSPPQSTTLSEIFPFDELEYNINNNEYRITPLLNNLGTTLPTDNSLETILINLNPENSLSDTNSSDFEDDKLTILAQPKAFYRERYSCEIDPKKKRAQRYIRTEDGNKYEHPTIKIPSKWRHSLGQLYIRVTSVTIKTKRSPYHCVHPYEIDTPENNVIKDKENNSLYFPVTDNEMNTGEKSFLISRTKMIQNDLKAYGPFRLFDSDQFDGQRVQNLQDAKQKIALYELPKSQFVFTIAELQNNTLLLVSKPSTSVKSIIMTDETAVLPHLSSDLPNGTIINPIKCIPQQGNWIGGEEIVIIMPNPIKRKEYNITFDFGEYGQSSIHEIITIDTKTLLFRTPTCPLIPGDENLKISILIQDKKLKFPPIDFHYLTPLKTIINLCSHCQGNLINNKKKRRCEDDDNGESLISQMNQLSIEKRENESHSQMSSEEKNKKLDKYLNQLKDALEIFVRENDPSRLFRRTRVLLSKFNGKSSPLNDAIEHGYRDLSLSLIKQIIDMPSPNRLLEDMNENGETALLIAGKMNEWKMIECILKCRNDLVKQKDGNGSNLLHILANLSEDKGAETIKNVLKTLPNDLKSLLKKEKNEKQETPMNIAQSHGNTESMNLLAFSIDMGKKI